MNSDDRRAARRARREARRAENRRRRIEGGTLEAVADAAALFADSEGLHGHAVSATARREGGAK